MAFTDKVRMYKSFIVSYFYDLRNFSGSITTLAGPQLKRVVDIADRLNPDYINVYEICPRTYEKQIKDKQKHYDKRDDITLNFESLENADITEFIDADLMKTYITDGKIIESLFKKQLKIESDGDKVFVGTLSLRGTTKVKAFIWLENLVKPIGKAKITDDIIYKQCQGKNEWMRKYNVTTDSNINLDLFTYNDKEGIMLTFRIIY
tara:strand:- start:102 stop:719 length:618 start_codon:yes stop_codon:yes gene_type:complete